MRIPGGDGGPRAPSRPPARRPRSRSPRPPASRSPHPSRSPGPGRRHRRRLGPAASRSCPCRRNRRSCWWRRSCPTRRLLRSCHPWRTTARWWRSRPARGHRRSLHRPATRSARPARRGRGHGRRGRGRVGGWRRTAHHRAEGDEAGRAPGAVPPALDRPFDDGGAAGTAARVRPASRAGRGAEVRPVLATRTDEARLVRRVPHAVQLADRGALAGETVGHRVGPRELERVEAGDRSVEADRHRAGTRFDDDHRARAAPLRVDVGVRGRSETERRRAHHRDEQGPQAAPAAGHPVKCGVTATASAAAAGAPDPGVSGVSGTAQVGAAATVIGNHDRSSPSTVCDVANVFTPKLSFGLAMRPASAGGAVSCWERSHAVGLAYALPAVPGSAVSRQHDDVHVEAGGGDGEDGEQRGVGVVGAERLPGTAGLLVGGVEGERGVHRRVGGVGTTGDEGLDRDRGGVGVDVGAGRVAVEVPATVRLLVGADGRRARRAAACRTRASWRARRRACR